jgi:competence protein ComK
MRTYHIINTETTALVSYYENGHEYSRVLEGKETFLVSLSPDQIVEDSFSVLGNDLAGSSQGARSILKGKYMVPVALSAELGIILIRCNSIRQKGTIWLNNSHIQNIQPFYNGQSIVQTSYGHSLTITMKAKSLQEKRNQATFLEKTLLQRYEKIKTRTFLYEKNNGFSVVKDYDSFNYSVKQIEEEDSD